MIEQVKGFSYPVFSLLGASSLLPTTAHGNVQEETSESIKPTEKSKKSWWRVSLASPKVWDPTSSCPKKGLFYCVIYLKPGDYHRIHSPADWNILVRRHFSGHLYPVNERATRTIRNLYIENERVIYISLVITIGNERVSCLSSICILVKASCFYLSIYVFLQFKKKLGPSTLIPFHFHCLTYTQVTC